MPLLLRLELVANEFVAQTHIWKSCVHLVLSMLLRLTPHRCWYLGAPGQSPQVVQQFSLQHKHSPSMIVRGPILRRSSHKNEADPGINRCTRTCHPSDQFPRQGHSVMPHTLRTSHMSSRCSGVVKTESRRTRRNCVLLAFDLRSKHVLLVVVDGCRQISKCFQ